MDESIWIHMQQGMHIDHLSRIIAEEGPAFTVTPTDRADLVRVTGPIAPLRRLAELGVVRFVVEGVDSTKAAWNAVSSSYVLEDGQDIEDII